MIASYNNNINVVKCLIQNGASVDLRDKDGYTALHYALLGQEEKEFLIDYTEVVNTLLDVSDVGASQVDNTEQLPPLLFASNLELIKMVENLIKRPDCMKERRIDALELLGATIALSGSIEKGLYFLKRGMEERFEDSAHPLLKEAVSPIEAYQNKKESQSHEDLALLDGNEEAVTMECLITRERICGPRSVALIVPIMAIATYFSSGCFNDKLGMAHRMDVSTGLMLHAIEISQRCNQPIKEGLTIIMNVFEKMIKECLVPREKDIIELFAKIVCEYKRGGYKILLIHAMFLLKFFSQLTLREKENDQPFFSHLREFLGLNPKEQFGNTLLHLVATTTQSVLQPWFYDFPHYLKAMFHLPCVSSVKAILDSRPGVVDVTNDSGDTALHLAARFKPEGEHVQLLTDMLQVLHDKGAHHDYVNKEGKTAIDVAETQEARSFLSDRSSIQLQCIAAIAVKKFGLPYYGIVPKVLEEFIDRH